MSSSNVTYRPDGTKVTVTIEGNVKTTVYEKDGHIRREKIFLESESEQPQRRPWGGSGGPSHTVRVVPVSGSSSDHVKRVVAMPSSNSSPAPAAVSHSVSLPAAPVAASLSVSRLPSSHNTPETIDNASSNSGGYDYRYSVAPPMQPPAPPPASLELPFEAVGVTDFDVMPIEQGEEYEVVEVSSDGGRFACRGYDGRLAWFPARCVRPIPPQSSPINVSSPMLGHRSIPVAQIPPLPSPSPTLAYSTEAIIFQVGPDGQRIPGTDMKHAQFLSPAPLAEPKYTTVTTPNHIRKVSFDAVVEAAQRSPIRAALPSYTSHTDHSSQSSASPEVVRKHVRVASAPRANIQIASATSPPTESNTPPSPAKARLYSVAPPMNAPAPPPPESSVSTFDPFNSQAVDDFSRNSRASSKLGDEFGFDEIDASLASVKAERRVTTATTTRSPEGASLSFDEIDATLALIAHELESPIELEDYMRPQALPFDNLPMEDDEIDNIIMEEELSRAFSDLEHIAADAAKDSQGASRR